MIDFGFNPKYFQVGQLIAMKDINRIVVHHTGVEEDNIDSYHSYHKEYRGWLGIGYNYIIDSEGKLINGRGMYVGAHAKGFNSTSLGIAFVGDFNKRYPNFKQLRTFLKLKNVVDMNFGIVPIENHYSLNNTKCPVVDLSNNNIKLMYLDYVDDIMETLEKEDLINSPNYWKKVCRDVEYLDLLFYNIYKKFR